jgi:hypothetical protein
MSPEPLVLHVLVRKTETGVTAQCLEIDHISEGLTHEEAMSDMIDLVRSQFVVARREEDFDNLLFPAPTEDWRLLARARLVGSRLVDLQDDEAQARPPIPVAATGVKLQEFTLDAS